MNTNAALAVLRAAAAAGVAVDPAAVAFTLEVAQGGGSAVSAEARKKAALHVKFGAMLQKSGKPREAMGHFRNALKLDPRCAPGRAPGCAPQPLRILIPASCSRGASSHGVWRRP